jgi:hypothetical protein
MSKVNLRNVGGMKVASGGGHGVLIESVHWEHYCEQIEDMDLATLDEANFLSGSASVFVSMVVALIGVAVGASGVSSAVYLVFGSLTVGSAGLTLYWWHKYNEGKKSIKKTGGNLARRMRDVSEKQRKLLEEAANAARV